jgi:hypothetical protein
MIAVIIIPGGAGTMNQELPTLDQAISRLSIIVVDDPFCDDSQLGPARPQDLSRSPADGHPIRVKVASFESSTSWLSIAASRLLSLGV